MVYTFQGLHSFKILIIKILINKTHQKVGLHVNPLSDLFLPSLRVLGKLLLIHQRTFPGYLLKVLMKGRKIIESAIIA